MPSTGLTLPFAHLNLRRNPFGELDRDARAAVALVDTAPLAADEIVQFIGEGGRGKTTRLLALAARHPGSVYEYVPEGSDRLVTPIDRRRVTLVDEAQRVRPRLLRELFARAGALAIATHEDLSGLTRRPVRTVVVAGMTAARLGAIVERRIEAVRRGPGTVPTLGERAAARLLAAHGDDVRASLGRLYEIFQSLTGPGDVEV